MIPDIQAKPGVPLDHCRWIGQALVEYRPDVVVNLGDTWDFPSLNSHEKPGSQPLEGARYKADLESGAEAMRLISEPMERECRRSKAWRPRKIFLLGNHEDRADRACLNDPKYCGHVGSENCDTRDWERHKFLKIVNVDSVLYAHYFANTHSGRPIGGTVQNRLSKIGASFVQGHQQGYDVGKKLMASGRTWTGIVAGSAYPQREEYRGNQGQRHWRGVVVLNEVEDGEFCEMPLTLDYLARKYERQTLHSFMCKKYPYDDWSHLGCHEQSLSLNASGPRSSKPGMTTAGNGRPAQRTGTGRSGRDQALASRSRQAA